MALDPTARESNFRDSIKKYFVDNLNTTEGIDLLFDTWLSTPDIGISKSVTRWVTVNFEEIERDTLSEARLTVIPSTRNDSEGFKLAQLTDTVMGYLSDENSTTGMRTIPFYRSRNIGAWTAIGGIVIIPPIHESAQLVSEDGTKYKMLSVRCKFASKV